AAGRLRHPNIVDVTDFGVATLNEQTVAYLVMEYLDGCSLDDVLREDPKLPLGWVVDLFEPLCHAVDEAHRRGILHRGLKPSNIWLEPNALGGFTVKVLDFGLAKLEASPEERPATLAPSRAATDDVETQVAGSTPSREAIPVDVSSSSVATAMML